MTSRNLSKYIVRKVIAAFVMNSCLAIAGLLMAFIPASVHAQSALDVFNPGANGPVGALAVQADGKILVGGNFTMLGGGGEGTTQRNYIGRLNPDGSLDATFHPGANGIVAAFAVQEDGKILVGGNFTTLGGGGTGTIPRNRIGRLNADGSLDTSFDPGADAAVYAIAVQPDGKILVGGSFTTLGGGGTGTTPRNRIGRLNADGSLDTSFNPGVGGLWVYTLAVQEDGKILVGGFFETLGGSTRYCIGRLNADGTLDTSFNPGARWHVYAIAVQPDGKILVGGQFHSLGGIGTIARNYIGRIHADGSLDTSFDPGADSTVMSLAVQPDGKILVGGHFSFLGGGGTGTTPRNRIGRINADGSLDTDFDPGAGDVVVAIAVQADGKILAGGGFNTLGGGGTGTATRNRIGRLNEDGSLETDFNPGANGTVSAIAVQPDGKILVGGYFTTLGGGLTGSIERYYIGRLHADGSVDTSFEPGANNIVSAIAVQPDGKILVGGYFTALGGGEAGTITRNYIGRLNADGTVDTSFDPGADAYVYALAVQPDGKILVGGFFSTLGGGGTGTITRNYIGRLNADGSIDPSFDPGANRDVVALSVQPEGKILVAGEFTKLGGGGTGTTTRNRIGRLNADGSLDQGFNPGANDAVFALAVQPDGKILAGGRFTTVGGGGTGTITRNRIGRLNADGSCDLTFNPGANGLVTALALQANGKILVAGDFTALGGGSTGLNPRSHIGRLNANGSIDASFDPGADDDVYALALQADGKILVGGNFDTLGGGGTGITSRHFIGRLTNTDAALQNLTLDVDGTTVTWTRGGSSPEVGRVLCEFSTDGAAYHPLGDATRIPGGWQLTGVSLPKAQSLFIRALGFYSSGFENGSGSVAESLRAVFLAPSLHAGIDFNGDTLWDAFLYDSITGAWSEHFGSGTGFVNAANGWWSPAWQITPADFNGDGITDLFLYNPDDGYWYKAVGNGSGSFTYHSGQWSAGWDVRAANLNGDDRSDIFLFHPALGIWFRCISPADPADGFGYSYGYWTPGWTVYTVDWNGDSKTDIFLYNKTNGSWNQVTNTDPDSSVWSYSAGSWMPGWDIYPGDFNGDGKTDLFLYMPASGAWYFAMNTGSGFSYTAGYWAPDWKIHTGDFDGDGATDIFVYSTATGQWYQCISDKAGYFGAYYTGNWATVWQVHVADYNNDGKADVFLHNPDSGGWYLCVTQPAAGTFAYYPGAWDPGMSLVVKR